MNGNDSFDTIAIKNVIFAINGARLAWLIYFDVHLLNKFDNWEHFCVLFRSYSSIKTLK